MEKRKHALSATQLILLGFLAAILFGSILLSFPFASADGEWTNYIDALFTATTAVCVTGLTVVDTFSHWSLAGKIIILILIQLGGLGIISFTTGIMLLLGKKVTLKNRLLLESAFNLDSLSGLVRFLKKVLRGTLLVEAIGMVLVLPVFVPKNGLEGVWISLFHSVSAFCNAGIDILGPDSLIPYATDFWLNVVTMLLIIVGGIGFIVWWDLVRVGDMYRHGEIKRHHIWMRLSLHTKITLVTTLTLILTGWVLFAVFEWNNPDTIGGMGFGEKTLCALFQSVTTRTAGFATISQNKLSNSSVLLSIILMFIGGSSVGTAGGIKTSTVALVVLCAITVVKGRDKTVVFRRTIPNRLVHRALAVIAIALGAFVAFSMLLSTMVPGELKDVLFETASALGTAGLTCGISGAAGNGGKIVLIVCMYLGRVGPISLVTAFAHRNKGDRIVYPEQTITIG